MTRKRLTIVSIVIFICLALLVSKITFDFSPEIEGFFILKGEKGNWLEFTDDLVPEDATRLIWAMPLYPFKTYIESSNNRSSIHASIDFKWDRSHGRGFIRNTWPDGRKLIINLGRFRDSNGKCPYGIFIGGGLPPSDPDYQFMNNDETGMSYFDGQRWYHVWCNSNEGLFSPSTPNLPLYPTDWVYNGSWIREYNDRDLTIESNHQLMLNNVPLDVKRFLFYRAGNSYVILLTEIINRGNVPVTLQYQYGDEPWVGNFGSSAGDVGWTGKELILTERELNTQRTTYLGMFDYGNVLAGEDHNFTGIANFIEWEKNERPDNAYISNFSGGVINPEKQVPLVSKTNRFIGLQWGPRDLQPGESFSFPIAVGMATNDPKTGFPLKPRTELTP